MHTTIAFSEAVGVVAAAWANIAAVPDQHMKTEGDFIYIGDYNKLIGYLALPGTLGEEVRISSPSIRAINPYYLTPFESAIVPAADVFKAFFPNAALPLLSNEGLECEQYVSAAAEPDTVVLFLASVAPDPIKGNVHTIRFTCDPVQTVSVWEYAEIALIDELPVGTYDIVGARLFDAAGIAFRFVPVGGFNRPGGIFSIDDEVQEPRLQRHGGLGVWMTFNNNLLPGIEVLFSATAVAADLYGYMDVIPH